jgi:hypothetical protein
VAKRGKRLKEYAHQLVGSAASEIPCFPRGAIRTFIVQVFEGMSAATPSLFETEFPDR